MKNFPTWTCVVAVALERDDGRWLMHRRPDHKHHGGLWEFPGGKVEADETPVIALIREIREELGIELSADALVPVGFAESEGTPGSGAIVILLYKARSWEGEAQALEGGAIDWFTPAETRSLDRPPLDIALCATLFSMSAE